MLGLPRAQFNLKGRTLSRHSRDQRGDCDVGVPLRTRARLLCPAAPGSRPSGPRNRTQETIRIEMSRWFRCGLTAIGRAAVAILLGGCATGAREPATGPAPATHPVGESAAFFAIVDTDEDIWPDPIERTYVRLSILRNLITDFSEATHRLPADLQELSPPGDSLPRRITHDAWNHPIAFRRDGAGYELRAPGPDETMYTADDVVLRPGQALPIVQESDSIAATLVTMRSMQRLIRVYRDRQGHLPGTIDDVKTAQLNPYLGTTDEWGTEIRYTRRGSEVELRS